VALDSVEVLVHDDQQKTYASFLDGDVHWAPDGYPRDRSDEAASHPGFYAIPTNAVYFLRLNCRRKPLDDPRVRRALGLALDRRALIEAARVRGVPALAFVPPGTANHRSPPGRFSHDVDLARRLLAEAGYPEGRGLRPLEFLFNENEGHRRIAEYLKEEWRRTLGIEIRSHAVHWGGFLERTHEGDYDVARAGWIGDFDDPEAFLGLWRSWTVDNSTGWGDARFDRLLRLAGSPHSLLRMPPPERKASFAGLSDPARLEATIEALRVARGTPGDLDAALEVRTALLTEAEAIVLGEAPVIPVYVYSSTGLVDPRVEGFTTRAVDARGAPILDVHDRHPLRDLGLRR
jgi:oligopeptide transport system substrate-binding protein